MEADPVADEDSAAPVGGAIGGLAPHSAGVTQTRLPA